MEGPVPPEGTVRPIYAFGDFTLDVARGALWKSGAEVKLRPKSFDVLAYLVQAPGRLVSKDELLAGVWGAVVVTEGSITQCLLDIRRALDDQAQRIIRTVPRRGYIFEAPVTELDAAPGAQSTVSVASAASAVPTDAKRARTRVIGISLIVVLLAAGALVAALSRFETNARMARGNSDASIKSIAVLPFADLSQDRDQQYLAEGIAEEILDLLARSASLHVIARTSSFAFKGTNVDVATIGSKLNVAYVLEGSVRKSNDHVRVTAKLVDTATRSAVWSDSYDRTLDDALALEIEVAGAVAHSLHVALDDAARRDASAPRRAEVFSLYLQGRFFHNRRAPGDIERAVKLYQDALDLDPGYALAWVGLAAAYRVQVGDSAISAETGLAQRRFAVARALTLEPRLAEAHVQAATLAWDSGDPAAALDHHREAVALAPDNPMVLVLSANVAAWQDRLDEAIKLARREVTLDPIAAVPREHLGSLLLAAGRFEEAKAEFIKQSELNPATKPETELAIAFVLVLEGRFDEAARLIDQWVPSDDRDEAIAMIGPAIGRTAEADAAMTRLSTSPRLGSAVQLAEVYSFRGRTEKAFTALKTAQSRLTASSWSSQDGMWLWQWRFSPFLRPLHADPRWLQIRPSQPPRAASVAAR